MEQVHVNLGAKSYNIEIAEGLLNGVGSKIRQITKAEKAVIITDSNVGPLYGDTLHKQLTEAGFDVTVLTFAAGEHSKNLTVLGNLYEGMAKGGLNRSDVLIALGGGVTGDMGGLAAATFLRGIDFIQIPTSLLAQIDSSVGGKVAIDLPQGKNLVGAFYQPKAVYIDPLLLNTLPARFLHDGLAEAVKYGCICDKNLFEKLAAYADDKALLADVTGVIACCCNIKARLVEKDEFDTGDRMLLNLGHTLGHAVEKTYHYETYTHGEGVAIGMVHLTTQTEKMGLTQAGTVAALKQVLTKYQLPVAAELTQQDFMEAIALDKKKRGHSITLILMKAIGETYLQKVDFKDLPPYLG